MSKAQPKDVVRNIVVSDLCEAGKVYRMPAYNEPKGRYVEDPNGTLKPEYTHCWVTWQRLVRPEDSEAFWSNEAEMFKSLAEANEYAEILQEQLEK